MPAQFEFGGTYSDEVPFTLVLFSKKYNGFTSGNLTLESGRHIVESDEGVVMISKELADYNNLNVGDTLQLYIDYTSKMIDLEIVGIFSGTEGSGNDLMPSTMAGNQGIVDFGTSVTAYDYDELTYDSLDIYVEDPLSIQNVYDEIAQLPEVKGKTFTLGIDSEEYESISNPLESLQKLVQTILVIIIIVSLAILTLLLTLWTRGRVKETGILMSIGVSKGKIIGQFVLEVVMIAILAFGTSYFVSDAIAETAGNFILQQVGDSESAEQSEDISEAGYYDSSYFDQLSGSSSSEITEINVEVTYVNLMLVYFVGTMLIVFAVIIASYTILRLKPREILSKMS